MERDQLKRSSDRFLAALNGKGFNGAAIPMPATPSATAPRPPAKLAPVEPVKLSENAVPLGTIEGTASPVGLDLARLLDGRLLIQGASGAGKSWLLRRLLEQSVGRIQQIVIDPEGEFRSLADELHCLYIDATRFDGAGLGEIAMRARQHQLSLILDLSQLGREEQMVAVAAFCHALIEAPREHWHPAMVAIDEAHLFAPFGGQASTTTGVRQAAIAAVVDLMSRGRKRGLAGVLATQRLARLSKSVVSEVHNFMVGINTLDLDVRRAAETIGWDARKAFDRLPALHPGEFVVSGQAFSVSPVVVSVGAVRSHHSGAAPSVAAPQSVAPEAAEQLLDLETLAGAAAERFEQPGAAVTPAFRVVRQFIRDPSFALAGRVFEALRPLMPEGASIAGLAAHLDVAEDALIAALALLEAYNAVERSGAAVRIEAKFFSGGSRQ